MLKAFSTDFLVSSMHLDDEVYVVLSPPEDGGVGRRRAEQGVGVLVYMKKFKQSKENRVWTQAIFFKKKGLIPSVDTDPIEKRYEIYH